MPPRLENGNMESVESAKPRRSWLSTRTIIMPTLTLFSVLFVLWGAWLAQTQLSNHTECDMTWSRPQYLLLDDSDAHYKLYKFVDARDVRHEPFFKHNNKLSSPNDGWCMNSNKTVIPILFIPGHGGHYQQARSLGAHCTGWTRRQESRRDEHKVLQRLLSNNDHCEVYTIDWQEEWTALHGAFMHRQTAYVKKVLEFLVETCRFDSIVLVGHSMGGWIAQKAADPAVVSTIITLATPMTRPVLTWSWEAMEFHASLLQDGQQQQTIISISGGVRDEMVPPEAVDSAEQLSLLAVDVMVKQQQQQTQPQLGSMDHRAIVWCHNLLEPLHRMILQPQAVKLDDETYSFQETVQRQRQTLRSEYGTWMAVAMETGLEYNVEWLVWFFALVGAWHYYFGSKSGGVFVVMATTLVAGSKNFLCPPQLSTLSAVSLALVARAIFLGIQYLLLLFWNFCRRFANKQQTTRRLLFLFFLLSGSIAKIVQKNGSYWKTTLILFTILSVYGLALVNFATRQKQDVAYCAWILPLFALLVTGDVVVLSWAPLAWCNTCTKVGVPILVRFVWINNNHHRPRPVGLAALCIMIAFGLGRLNCGLGLHPIGELIVFLTALDIFRFIIPAGRKQHAS